MIKPLAGYALIQDEFEEKTTQSGIIKVFNEGERSKGVFAKVLAINSSCRCADCGAKRSPLPVKEGDTIVYSKFAAEPIDMKGEDGKPVPGIKTIHVDSIIAISEAH